MYIVSSKLSIMILYILDYQNISIYITSDIENHIINKKQL